MRTLAAFLAVCLACLAASTFRGIEPGVSTRADAERVLGQAPRTSGQTAEYALADGSGRVYVRYRGTVVDRIDVLLASAVPKTKLYAAMKLPAAEASEVNSDGKLVEYFGAPRTLAMVHSTNTPESDIASISYCSQELFDQLTARFRPQPGTPETPAAPVYPPPPPAARDPLPPPAAQDPPAPPSVRIEQYDPSACRDIYDWAQGEQKQAEKSKSPDRRQAILAIRITSQKGDCPAARQMATDYRAKYR